MRYSNVTRSGGYTAQLLPFGTLRVTITHPGFGPLRTIVQVTSPAPVELTFTLELDAVKTSVVVRILPDALDSLPGWTDEALRQTPGVHVVDEDAFGLNLNVGVPGLNPRRTERPLLMEDGAPIHLGRPREVPCGLHWRF